MHRRKRFPLLAAVISTENIAGILILHAPGGDKHCLGILRINRDVIEHIIVASAELGKASPVMAAIFRDKNHTGASAEENAVRVLRIISEAAYVAPIRTQNGPLIRRAGRKDRS